ncbi:MAG: uridine kinase [Actinomycetota bacterium]|nr:uridine kinase [Actinomycetota bacterium]
MRVNVWGIGGGSGAGKTTLTHQLVERLGSEQVAILPVDNYYLDLGHLTHDERRAVNFDHPSSIDVDLFAHHLDELAAGRGVDLPNYDFASYTRVAGSMHIEPRPVVIVEGMLLYALAGIGERCDLSIYLRVPADVRCERRVRRDVAERGRVAADVERVFTEVVVPMHDRHVAPFAGTADLVIEHGDDRQRLLDELVAYAAAPHAVTTAAV